ncbi:MAG: acyl-CoA dehydrogenase [Desulfovibrionaceae bacterium]|nr:acyl-CoA dehydrogenase [Desulfovibrionaceae bacterium]
MNFTPTEEQLLIQQMAREFAQKEIAPIAAEIDREQTFPMQTVKRMGELGLFGLFVPEDLGGGGADYISYALALEEIAAVCASHAAIYSVHSSASMGGILSYGTEEQKKKYIPGMASGERIGAFTVTEPGAGTDAGAQKATAVLQGDKYILNGTKIFCTNGGIADVYLASAMTDPSKGLKGISTFIVEKSFPGFKVGQKEDKMGIRGSQTTEIIYSNCEVPAENLLGKEGEGFKVIMQILDGGRIGMAAQAVGIARGALDAAIAYVKDRQQFGKPLAANQGLQWMLAEMALAVEASRVMVFKAACAKEAGGRFSKEAAMAKLIAAETAMSVTTRAVQLHGGIGYTKSCAVERYMRDAKITEIYEGTNEVMKMVIAGNILA